MSPFDQASVTKALSAAAIDPARWTNALEKVAACTGSHGALLLPIAGPLPMVSATPSMEKTFALYVEGEWFNRDERYLGRDKLISRGIITDDDCLPVEARRRSAFYQDLMPSCRLTDFAGVRVGRKDQIWCLSLQRTSAQGPFSRDELHCLGEIAQTLDSVVEISCALGMAKGEAALDAFQFSDRGALLLDRSGRVVRANDAAERLIGRDLQISGGKVRSPDPGANERLKSLIRMLLWSQTSFTAAPVILPKLSGGRLIVYPMRLHGLTHSPLSAFHAILMIVDTDASRSLSIATLKAAFDLTAAEARVAAAIGSGKNLAASAVEIGVSRETIRSHLKNIFLKTGTRRQAELAAVIATFVSEH